MSASPPAERRPDLCVDLGNVGARQMRQPCRDPRRHRQHAGAHGSQDAGPLRLDGGGIDQFAAQLGGLQFV
jgi:hypothetical protein